MRRWLYRAAADILTRAVNALEWRLAEDLGLPECAACEAPTGSYLPCCDIECARLAVAYATAEVPA